MHTPAEIISESEAIERFHPERLPRIVSTKISKTPVSLSRWEEKPAGAKLGIVRLSKAYDDLCWWNDSHENPNKHCWVYITTNKNK